jgi:predicted neutral ceramidase superfamily lipid hydrolase
MKPPKFPKEYFQSLTLSERANYIFDVALFGFIIANGHYVSQDIQGYAYLMGLAFFLACVLYSQFRPR